MTPPNVPTTHGGTPAQSRNATSRRSLLRTGAWAAPAITLAGAAPAYARSSVPLPSALPVTQASWARTNIAGNLAGWLGAAGDGVPGTPGGNAPAPAPSTPIASGFHAAAQTPRPAAGSFTAVWNVNVTSLKALTVSAQVHAPTLGPLGLRQTLQLTLSKDTVTETVGAAHHSVTSPTAAAVVTPPESTAVAPGGIVTLSRTFTPTSIGLWSITATFSNGGDILPLAAMQPFVLETPSVTQAV